MNEYDYVYTRERREFGLPCSFSDTTCVILHQIPTDQQLFDEFTHLNPPTLILDNIPELSCHSVNTERVLTESRGQSHSEGGWPKEIDAGEPQDTSKWRKRLDKDPQFSVAVSSLCKEMKQTLDQNNAIDMFQDYYADEPIETEMHSLQSSTIALYKDQQQGPKRAVSRISWHPDGPSKFIASYSMLKFQRVDADQFNKASYIWDVENPNFPVFEFSPISPLVVTQYYSRNSDLVAAGGSNGLVEFFDLRSGSKCVSSSTFEHSHNDPVFDLSWLQSKTHCELVSTSPDGRVLWWDTRNLSAPTDVCVLTDNGRTYSGSCLEWQQEAGPTKYLIGTEEGVGLALTKKPKKSVEVGGWFGADDHGGQYRHFGPIYSIKRNLFHPKYFLTVGDWGVKVWLEELKTPLFQTSPSVSTLTCGGWSPSRAGLLFAGRFDGVVDFFDYNYQMNETAYSHKVGDVPISSCVIEGRGELMAVGDASGTVTIVRLCDELAVPSNSEKVTFGVSLEREQRRERNLDALKKQQGLKSTNLSDPKIGGFGQPNTIDQQQYVTMSGD